MVVNTDPKPGRWILPLVILGMVAFTYFFVRELPEATTETTLIGADTTTTDPTSETTDPSSETTVPDPTAAYLDALDQAETELATLAVEMAAVNDGFDADPRTIEISEADDRLVVVADATQALLDSVSALTPPVGLETSHQAIVTALTTANTAATSALEGLRSTDTGALRRAAATAYQDATDEFSTEVANARTAAGATDA